MRKQFLPVVLCLLCPTIASAAWIKGTIAALQKSDDGRTVAVVVIEDDKGAQDKFSFIDDVSNIRARIITELTRRNAADVVAVDLVVGTVVALPVVVPPVIIPPTPPTAEQIAKAKFFADWTLALNLKPYADAGILDAQTAYAAALALAMVEFKASYVSAP